MTRENRFGSVDDQDYTILVLYDPAALHAGNTWDHLLSFKRFSAFTIYFADAIARSICYFDLALFDAVIIHYSCCIYRNDHLSPSYVEALTRFAGPKVLFLQDEYDLTDNTIRMVKTLGIDVFYTTITADCFERVYPRSAVGDKVSFISTLTGYVPLRLKPEDLIKPWAERPVTVGYRARKLHYRYGDLGQDKFRIGERMKAECLARGLPCDIEWDEDKRIYGARWSDFLENCRVTLGSESASNVFDHDGSLRAALDAELARNPGLSYAEARRMFLADREGRHGPTSMISPRVFEAMALKTGLVMFEGSYSCVVEPERHYIPLAKDFGNIDQVMARIADRDYMEELVERAYDEIIASGRYSHRRLIEDVDAQLRRHMGEPRGVTLFPVLHAALPGERSWSPDSAPAADRLAEVASFAARSRLLHRDAVLSSGDEAGIRHLVTGLPLYPLEQEILREDAAAVIAIPVLTRIADLPSDATVHIFGTGDGARLLHDEILRVTGHPPTGFIDLNLSGDMLGVPVRRLDDFAGAMAPDTPVLLSNRFVVENARVLAARGFSRVFNGRHLVRALARAKP